MPRDGVSVVLKMWIGVQGVSKSPRVATKLTSVNKEIEQNKEGNASPNEASGPTINICLENIWIATTETHLETRLRGRSSHQEEKKIELSSHRRGRRWFLPRLHAF
jgi:hypothetical protein